MEQQRPSPRPLVQQSNQVVKRLALLGVQEKQLQKPELRKETVKEPSITFLAFMVDRIMDHLLTAICHYYNRGEEITLEDIQLICARFLSGFRAQQPDLPTTIFEQLPDYFAETDESDRIFARQVYEKFVQERQNINVVAPTATNFNREFHFDQEQCHNDEKQSIAVEQPYKVCEDNIFVDVNNFAEEELNSALDALEDDLAHDM